MLEVGDAMSRKGWHLNAISNPAAVHIAVTVRLPSLHGFSVFNLLHDADTMLCVAWEQRLTIPVVDSLIADLKDAVSEAKLAPAGTGTMVMLYGASPPRPSPNPRGNVARG